VLDGKKMARIIDIEMRIENDWNEYTKTIGADIKMCEDLYALWQAYEGELKTRLGVVRGFGLKNYGSRLYTLLGENLADFTFDEPKGMIQEVSSKYPMIKQTLIDVDQVYWDRGQFKCEITLITNFGRITKVFINEGGC
jgi:hypothetical protein